MLIPVQFLSPYSIYNLNEVAGFERNVVDALIEKGVAKMVDVEAVSEISPPLDPIPQDDAGTTLHTASKRATKSATK